MNAFYPELDGKMRNYRRFDHKIIAAVLAMLIMFEPFTLTITRANDFPSPRIKTEKLSELPDVEDIVAPADYLEYMLKLRGKSKSEAEARAWGEWMMTCNCSQT
ncbi:MAG: hypothetical protein Kow0029_01910 [Candidatus Rifleibacteriota bacterium]